MLAITNVCFFIKYIKSAHSWKIKHSLPVTRASMRLLLLVFAVLQICKSGIIVSVKQPDRSEDGRLNGGEQFRYNDDDDDDDDGNSRWTGQTEPRKSARSGERHHRVSRSSDYYSYEHNDEECFFEEGFQPEIDLFPVEGITSTGKFCMISFEEYTTGNVRHAESTVSADEEADCEPLYYPITTYPAPGLTPYGKSCLILSPEYMGTDVIIQVTSMSEMAEGHNSTESPTVDTSASQSEGSKVENTARVSVAKQEDAGAIATDQDGVARGETNGGNRIRYSIISVFCAMLVI